MAFKDAISFIKDNHNELASLTTEYKRIVFCPSFPALYSIHEQLKQLPYCSIGGQNCSEYQQGPHTGEVSARMLAEVGCTFCIVGHSECRQQYQETNTQVARKVTQLLACGIEPIICVGEGRKEYEEQETFERLREQLMPVLMCLKEYASTDYRAPLVFSIAYEPVWSIGTGLVADPDYIKRVLCWIKDLTRKQLDFEYQLRLLYGGSVDPLVSPTLSKIDPLDGFLIGGASLDFQKLKNIVSLG